MIENKRIARKGIYRHYKHGDLYEVIGIGLDENPHQKRVAYKSLKGWPKDVEEADFFLRPEAEFLEDVVVNGILMPRFDWVNTLNEL